jgi:hypothetical protein
LNVLRSGFKSENSFKAEVKEIPKEADDFIFIKTDGKNNFEKCKLMRFAISKG